MAHENESSVNTAIKSVGTGPAAQEAYRDLLKPAFQELAPSLRAMAQCVALALLPLKAVAWSYERILGWLVPDLAEKLAEVPTEKVRSPDPTIAGPTLLYLPFVEHQEPLRKCTRGFWPRA